MAGLVVATCMVVVVCFNWKALAPPKMVNTSCHTTAYRQTQQRVKSATEQRQRSDGAMRL